MERDFPGPIRSGAQLASNLGRKPPKRRIFRASPRADGAARTDLALEAEWRRGTPAPPIRSKGASVPTTTTGLLCFVMGLLFAFLILTPFLEQSIH